MSTFNEWFNRLRHQASQRRFDADLNDEIKFHLETRASELEDDAGLSRPDALAQARKEFGSIALAQENSRAPWQFRWLEDFVADLRYCLRAFRRTPAFTLTAVLSLALGIGGTTAIYTALGAVLWRPLPVEDPNRLVTFSILRDNGAPETDLPAAFAKQLNASGIFAGLTVCAADGLSLSYDNGPAERIIGETVSPDYFDVLGVKTIHGHGFSREVQTGSWAPEAVISYDFWQRRFNGDPAVIGRTIRLNTYPFTIVGVSAPGFFGLARGTSHDLRIPILPEGQSVAQIEQLSGKPQRWLNVFARLKPGVTMPQAEVAADAQFQDFLRTTPIKKFATAHFRRLKILPGARGFDEYVQSFQTPLYVLLFLVAVVLLIACTNVANMLIARAAARTREFAIRTSIGAGRVRLIRQLLTESLLLSVLGGALGLIVANWAADVLFRFLPQGHISLAVDLHPDKQALIFTCALSLLTGLFFGLAPAFQATRGTLSSALKMDSNNSAGSERGAQFRKMLVVSQVAFSMLLLIAAGVFIRTLSDLRPIGYRSDPDHLLLFTMKPQQELYSDDQRRTLASELVRRVSTLPGVESAALAENGPFGSRASGDMVQVPNHEPVRIASDSVTPGFLDTVGIPLVAGRDFRPADQPGATRVVIVNQALAKTFFPGQNPLGRTLTIPTSRSPDSAYEIIGVAADRQYYDVHKASEPFLWYSIAQITPYLPTLHVRTSSSNSSGMIAAIKHEFDSLDKGFPVFNIRTMAVRIEDSLARERMIANLSGAFGMFALGLAAVGLYGILAYSVSRRTREIGLRKALGASTSSVLWMIAREALALVGAGSVAGLALALAAARLLEHYISGASSMNPAIIASCMIGMLLVAATSVAIPAAHGCRVDPLRALRNE